MLLIKKKKNLNVQNFKWNAYLKGKYQMWPDEILYKNNCIQMNGMDIKHCN